MLAPCKKSYDQPRHHIKKQRHTLPTKVHLVKAMFFPVVMYGCESWTIKKAEHWRIDALELWCWRRLIYCLCQSLWLFGPQQTVENSSRYGNTRPLDGPLEKSVCRSGSNRCKELTHWKRPWCWERLKAGEGDDRGWSGWMASPTQWTWVWVTPGVGDGQGSLACCSPWGCKELDTTEQLIWTGLNWCYIYYYSTLEMSTPLMEKT